MAGIVLTVAENSPHSDKGVYRKAYAPSLPIFEPAGALVSIATGDIVEIRQAYAVREDMANQFRDVPDELPTLLHRKTTDLQNPSR